MLGKMNWFIPALRTVSDFAGDARAQIRANKFCNAETTCVVRFRPKEMLGLMHVTCSGDHN
jgi:hypothetical protein